MALANCRKEVKYFSSIGQKFTKKKLTAQTMCNVCILCFGQSPVRGQWKRSKTLIQARKEPRRGLKGVKVALKRVELKVDMVARWDTVCSLVDLWIHVMCVQETWGPTLHVIPSYWLSGNLKLGNDYHTIANSQYTLSCTEMKLCFFYFFQLKLWNYFTISQF